MQPDLRQVRRYTSPTDRPLHIVEICGCLATGLHAALRGGKGGGGGGVHASHAVASYSWADINRPDALVALVVPVFAVYITVTRISSPSLPARRGTRDSHSMTIACHLASLETYPRGIDGLLQPPPPPSPVPAILKCRQAQGDKRPQKAQPFSTCVAHLIRHLEEVQPGGVGASSWNVPGVQRLGLS